jgi:hypothetical protein
LPGMPGAAARGLAVMSAIVSPGSDKSPVTMPRRHADGELHRIVSDVRQVAKPAPPRAGSAQPARTARRRSMEGCRLVSRAMPRTFGTPPPSCTNAKANSGAAPRAAANRSAANSLRRAT